MMWPHAQRAGEDWVSIRARWSRRLRSKRVGAARCRTRRWLQQLQFVWYQGGFELGRRDRECADAGIRRRRCRAEGRAFPRYHSPADSFNDYAKLIGNNPRYENARGAGGDVTTFASALQEGGYATDPNYAQKIVGIADEVRALTNNSSDNSLKFASASPTTGGSGGLRRF